MATSARASGCVEPYLTMGLFFSIPHRTKRECIDELARQTFGRRLFRVEMLNVSQSAAADRFRHNYKMKDLS